jgi:hypothetical protein
LLRTKVEAFAKREFDAFMASHSKSTDRLAEDHMNGRIAKRVRKLYRTRMQ